MNHKELHSVGSHNINIESYQGDEDAINTGSDTCPKPKSFLQSELATWDYLCMPVIADVVAI